MTTNTNDPSLTLLEERFLSSGYRKDILEDRLRIIADRENIIENVRSMPVLREWLGAAPYTTLRLKFDVLKHREYACFIEPFLRTFYEDVQRVHGAHETWRVYTVNVSPHDTQWLAIVSAHSAKMIEWKE